LAEGCTLGPTPCSTGCADALVRFEGGGGRVGYLRGVALDAVFAAEEAALEGPEPIVTSFKQECELEWQLKVWKDFWCGNFEASTSVRSWSLGPLG
jgi:hypothetical protein